MSEEIHLSPGKDRFTRFIFRTGAGVYAWLVGKGPEEVLRKEFLDFLAPKKISRLLDVGCGPGQLAVVAAKQVSEVVGVDRSKQMIKLARKNAENAALKNCFFDLADATELPFPENVFDIACATAVLYLLQDTEAGLREMHRVVRSGGTIAAFNPSEKMNPKNMKIWCDAQRYSWLDRQRMMGWARAAQLYRRRSIEEQTRFFESAGLKQIEVQEKVSGQVLFIKGKKV